MDPDSTLTYPIRALRTRHSSHRDNFTSPHFTFQVHEHSFIHSHTSKHHICNYRCPCEEHQGLESPNVTQSLNLSQNENLTDKTLELISGLGYNFVVLSMCIYQDIVLVSIVASVDRPDHAGVVESVQLLPGVQLGPPPPETTAGPALRILESCRVTAASEMPRSISSRCSLSPT